MRHADFGDIRLAYDTAGNGDGTPVLLVMGYTMPGRAWRHQIPELSKHHPVAWFDHRGAGRTEARAGAYTVGLLAGDTLRLMDHLGWARAHLVGVSMGGMVSQELTLRHPDRVRSLSLIVSHAGGRRPRLPPWSGLTRFVRANLGGDRITALQELLFPEGFLAECDREALAAVLRDDFADPLPPRMKLSQLAAVMRHRTAHRLPELQTPTLVVKATQDRLIHPKESDRLARLIPNARLIEFADAGHGIIRQSADALNRALLDHFAAADS